MVDLTGTSQIRQRAAAEGSVVAFVVLCFALVWSASCYRSAVSLSLAGLDVSRVPAVSQSSERLLHLALNHVNEIPSSETHPKRWFRVDALRNNTLRLHCHAEVADVADELCTRASEDALGQAPAYEVLGRQYAVPLYSPRAMVASAPALLLGVGWFFGRRRQLLRRRKALPERNSVPPSERWEMPVQTERAHMAPMATAVTIPLGAAQLPAAPVERDSLSNHARIGSAAPRVIYHVSANIWVPDEHVLTASTRAQVLALRNELVSAVDQGCRVIRVVSGVGSRYPKSQVATELAFVAADRDAARVVLMEADSDAPVLHKLLHLNLPRGLGFSEQLAALGQDDSTSPALTRVRLSASLELMVEGKFGTPAAYDSPQLALVVAHERQEHDLIVIDGPVVDDWPDVAALRGVVDMVVLVVASDTAPQDYAKLVEQHFRGVPVVKLIQTGP